MLKVRNPSEASPAETEIAGFSIAEQRTSQTNGSGDLRIEPIDGVSWRAARAVTHSHGHLVEAYRHDWGITDQPVVQVNVTTTFSGRIRAWGLHLHTVDRLFVSSGAVRIVCFDPRRSSPTFGRINEFFFGDRTQGLVVIPSGVYHGWKNVGDTEAVIVSMPSQLYDHEGPDRFELPWDAPSTREVIPYDW